MTTITTNYADHIDYISMDKNGSIYTNSHHLNIIRRYSKQTIPNGIIVAGTGSPVTGSLNRPVGTAVDDNFNLYIADQNNDRVVKLTSGSSTLMTVIVTSGLITQLSALLLPSGIANEIYISDERGSNVYLWSFGASTPSRTYSNIIGGLTLDRPRGMKLDGFGNLYVADAGNRQVVMFCVNSTIGTIVMQTTSEPVDLAFDSNMNLYVLQDDGKLYKYALY